jgi:hypothetical protein
LPHTVYTPDNDVDPGKILQQMIIQKSRANSAENNGYAKVVEADRRNLYIFDVDVVNGKEGVDPDDVNTEFCQYGMGRPLSNHLLQS